MKAASTSVAKRVAVVGAGISGLASAYLLHRAGHQVSVFEAGSYFGGHTNTVDVTLEGKTWPVDTGFLVFNDRTYPNLIALFAELGIPAHESDMSFSVSLDNGRLEWAGTNLNTVFGQRRNLFSPRFLGMVRDILRFNRLSPQYLQETSAEPATLSQLLERHRYGQAFRDDYLLPMAAAIWSSAPRDILDFPAATFLRFCTNHGLLQVSDRPQWRTVKGGARQYVQTILGHLPDTRCNTPVLAVARRPEGVDVTTATGTERFDAVILATHAPQSLAVLSDADAEEAAILGAFRYQANLAILHTDTQLLPKRSSLWSAWNYFGGQSVGQQRPVCVSYLINRLQPVPFRSPVVVTLNPVWEPAAGTEIARFNYEHPVMDTAAIRAQEWLEGIQGRGGVWHAGAWTGYGFHEDGLRSALRVARHFGAMPSWGTL